MANKQPLEAEILKTHQLFWESYANRNLELRFSMCLDDATFIGTGLHERAVNKAEYMRMNQKGVEQYPDKFAIDFLWTHVSISGDTAWVESESVWTQSIHAQEKKELLRNTTILRFVNDQWWIAHVHGSNPDYRLKDGEYMTNEQTVIKNQELEQQVYQRTVALNKSLEEIKAIQVQLEIRNRDLEIEASLERVRSVAMGMKQPSDMIDVCHIISDQLELLHVGVIRNVQTAIIDTAKSYYTNYQYFTPYREGTIEFAEYNKHPSVSELIQQMQQSSDAFFTAVFEGEELEVWRQYRKDDHQFPDPILDEATAVYFYFYSIGQGGLGISTFTPLSEENINIFKRFRNVFSHSYQRYKDITLAEAQAMEARIEASLERVRSRAMAMQSSGELGALVATVFTELTKLDFAITSSIIWIHNAGLNTEELWVASPEHNKPARPINLKSFIHPFFKSILQAWKERDQKWIYALTGPDKQNFEDLFFYDVGNLAETLKTALTAHEKVIFSASFSRFGAIEVLGVEALSEDKFDILHRIGRVFDSSYTRFNDLKQAEAQTREAQIELSLERVRARTMAMQRSDELPETSLLMFQQFRQLGETADQLSIGIINEEKGMMELSTTVHGSQLEKTLEVDIDEPFVIKKVYEAWKQQKKSMVIDLAGKDLKNYNVYRSSLSDVKFNMNDEDHWIIHIALFSKGMISFSTHEPRPKETIQLLTRFAGVFDLTYTRFLDLQRAEAQAREAIIEAALEKVRGMAMAMQSTYDVTATASMVFTELRKLGIHPIRTGVGLLNKENRIASVYAGTKSEIGDTLSLSGAVLLDHHPVFTAQYNCWVNQEDFFPVLNKEEVKAYYAHISENFNVPELQNTNTQYGFFLPFSNGFLFGWSETPYSAMEISILNRFKSIIDLTFRRYLDLQKSEANTREAVKQASLDRVRAEIASMRTTSDLEKITPLIWNELNILGVPFIRCGVFIMDEAAQLVHTFLSTPEGNAITAFHLPYTSPGNTGQIINHWKKNERYIDHWDENDFKEFAEILVTQGALASPEQYLRSMPRGGFYLHFLPFLQGMLYAGNTDPLAEEELQLLQTVAFSFSTAYARYEDFNKLESAKQQVENTLSDLKQAQQQLIQSEKMASLGELTAGIAHEIQNPLNFVNNFSEVNAELIDELKDELATGNIQSAKEIADNIKDNEEKIIFHGKRADAIVKGMLQHSRSSSGVKEPTDINALADEYLRLAYHGLRAKDKSFNATMKTDFDESIGLVNIVPQDIGRVILNLITNAFYAVSSRTPYPLKGGIDFEPTVSVSTKKRLPLSGGRGSEMGPTVEIRVKDNGPGIPLDILDKIFQPFFTTKPTGQGTGLGLSLSYDIVKAHGGELKVETKEGEGTEFIIQLPLVN